ncbi:hypothetical protein AGRA3207_004824 [Actinomadura graeca]|uniref:Uncharacterized protein n=1 Tax=Actinomadura graeca TaxID=2750812 RepID=A0ABX8QXW5_9ACTN|nr:hypothetical protein [Actinomadura graeca]QXJ23641.1 hypothetical protein AGRA3207_004824 [Actinomadura graeca]
MKIRQCAFRYRREVSLWPFPVIGGCRRYGRAKERSNAWVYLDHAGWRKLDDTNDDACTDLLVLAAQAKAEGAAVRVREDLRGGSWFVTEIYDLRPSAPPPVQEISFGVTECVSAGRRRSGSRARISPPASNSSPRPT